MSSQLGRTSDAPIDLTLSPSRRRSSAIPSGTVIINLDSDSDEENEAAMLNQMPSPAPPASVPRRPVNPTAPSHLRRSDISLLLNPAPGDVSWPPSESPSTAAPQPALLNRPNALSFHHIVNTSTPPTSTPFIHQSFAQNSADPSDTMRRPKAAVDQTSPIRTGKPSFGEARTQTTTSMPSPSLATSGPASRREKTTTESPYAPSRRDLTGSSRPGAIAAEANPTLPRNLGNMKSPEKTMGASVSTTMGEGVTKPRTPLPFTKTAPSTQVAKKSAPSSGLTSQRSGFRSPLAVKEKPRESAGTSHSRTASKQMAHVTNKETRHPDVVAKESVTVENESPQGVQAAQASVMPLVVIDVANLKVSVSVVEAILSKHFDELRVTHSLNVKHALRRHRLCYDRDAQAGKNKDSRSEQAVPTIPEKFLQKESPFADMKPIQTTVRAATKAPKVHLIQEHLTSSGKMSSRSYIAAPITHYRSEAPEVPYFHEYVTLRDNVLTENNRVLLYWPYFQEDLLEDIESKGMWVELEARFIMANEDRPRQVLQDVQCRLLSPYIERFFKELGISWEDVLFWLLAPESDITQIIEAANQSADADFDSLLLARDIHCKEDFKRQKHRWDVVYSGLPTPSIRNLRVTALACTAFLHQAGLSMWHLARRSEPARYPTLWAPVDPEAQGVHSDLPDDADEGKSAPSWEFKDTACRVCHVHDCFFHGEICDSLEMDYSLSAFDESSTESQRSGSESASPPHESDTSPEAYDDGEHENADGSTAPKEPIEKPAEQPSKGSTDQLNEERTEEPTEEPSKTPAKDAMEMKPAELEEALLGEVSDSDVEKPINYKKTISFNPEHRDACGSSSEDEDTTKYTPHYWQKQSRTRMLHLRRPFYPCNHEGSCAKAQCRCFKDEIFCEKSCGCDNTCQRRYHGCNCARNSRTGGCSKNSACLCRTYNRECDPELCGSCGAAEVLDPVNRYNEDIRKSNCNNVHIQLNLPKKTFLCRSEVHGFGLQIGEHVKANEYLGEYKGEVVTKGESGRRGTIYTHLKTNYLFQLNADQEVDSTHAGNKFRFINNSEDENIINCHAQVTLCNGVTRIGMFASRDLNPGEELYFNYGYPKEISQHFWEKGQKPPENNPGPAKKGKVVPVKTKKGAKGGSKGKAAAKQPKRKTGGKTESMVPSVRSIEERRAQTAKARESRLQRQRAKKNDARRSSARHRAPPNARASNRYTVTPLEDESHDSQTPELPESQESFPPPEIADSEVEDTQNERQSQADSFIEQDADDEEEDEEYTPELEGPEESRDRHSDGRLSTIAESDSSASAVLESLTSQDDADGSRLRNSMGMRLRTRNARSLKKVFPQHKSKGSTASNWSDEVGKKGQKRKREAAAHDEAEGSRMGKRQRQVDQDEDSRASEKPAFVNEESSMRKRKRGAPDEAEGVVTRKRARRIVQEEEDE